MKDKKEGDCSAVESWDNKIATSLQKLAPFKPLFARLSTVNGLAHELLQLWTFLMPGKGTNEIEEYVDGSEHEDQPS